MVELLRYFWRLNFSSMKHRAQIERRTFLATFIDISDYTIQSGQLSWQHFGLVLGRSRVQISGSKVSNFSNLLLHYRPFTGLKTVKSASIFVRNAYQDNLTLFRLAFIGVVQFGPQKLKEKDQVHFKMLRFTNQFEHAALHHIK